jgi:hypothetical protein
MANYSTQRWDAFKYKLNAAMNMPEFRKSPAPTLQTLLGNTDFLVPASEMERVLGVKQSDQDTVKINILNKQSISVTNARAAAHTGSKNDGKTVTASFTTYTANYGYSIKEGDRTIWELAEIQAKQILSAIIALHEDIESGLVTWLNTNKSQVVQSLTPRSTGWDASNYKALVTNTDYTRWMQRIKGFMREQKYKGLYQAIVDEVLFQEGEFLTQQGQGNSTNLSWQAAELNGAVSQNLTVASGSVGSGFIFPFGTVGILPWIPKLNKTGFGDAGLAQGFYTTLSDPFGTGLQFAVHERYVAADNQSGSGETQDVNVFVEISVDLAPIVAPMSTSNASPIFMFDVLEA